MRRSCAKTAEVYGDSAEGEMLSQVPPLICDPGLTTELVDYMRDMGIPGAMPYLGISARASENFASIAEKLPGSFIYLSDGCPDERGIAPAHNPKVRFYEHVCPMGAAAMPIAPPSG